MIDIIIPVYNVEKYLEKCVESVLAQSYTDYHIILVDDGAKDASGEICDRLAERSEKISVIHKANGGLSSARNAGIDSAVGDYILFLDSDDTLTKNALQILIDAMESGGIDAVFGGYHCVNEAGNTLHTLAVPEQVLSGNARFSLVYEYTYMVMACGKLYRRKLFEGVRFREGKLHEDVFIYHELAYHAEKIYCVEEPIINYLQRNDSIMGKRFSIRNFDAIDALFERASFFDEKKLPNCRDLTVQYIFKYLLYIIHRIDFHNGEMRRIYKDFYERWKLMSGISHDRGFGLLCFLYEKGLLRKALLGYSTVRLAKKARLLFQARVVVYRLLSNRVFKPRFILISTPMHGNLGDQAIVYSQIRFLQDCEVKNIVEIGSVNYLRYRSVIDKLVSPNDVIVIDGGGNIGSLWPTEANRINDIVTRFKANPIIIFPETAFFSDDGAGRASYHNTQKAFDQHGNLHVFLRDNSSYDQMRKMLPNGNVYLCPDIVLYLKGKLDLTKQQRKDAFLCMRNDIEKALSKSEMDEVLQTIREKNMEAKLGDTVIPGYVTAQTRNRELKKMWEQFSSSRLVITDRLHGMLFSYITNTPCLAFNNSNGKVLAQYLWIKNSKGIEVSEEGDDISTAIDSLLAGGQDIAEESCPDYSQLRGVIQSVKTC